MSAPLPPSPPSPTDAAGLASPERARATVSVLVALLLYVVSGAAGLVYEVAWTRRLLLLLGSTAAASALVLSGFLAGLGFGGAWGGRRADRSPRPLALYGMLEIGAAGWAVLVPLLLGALERPYLVAARSGAGVRAVLDLALVAIAVGPPAFLLGATFPAILRAATPPGRRAGFRTPLLYGLNTLGAVAGALWAGFDGIFTFGVSGALRIAGTVAGVVGLVALALDRRPTGGRTVPEVVEAPTRTPAGPLLLAAISGFLALGLEAAGVRILVFFVEGFTASFAAMLGVFLAGLAVGSLVLGPLLARVGRPAAAAGALLLLTGAVVVFGVVNLASIEDTLRGVREAAFSSAEPLAAHRRCALVGSALLLGAPAVLLGAVYPLAVRWAADASPDRLATAAGRVALANGLGALAAPLVVLLVGSLEAADRSPGGPLLAWTGLGLVALAAGVLALVGSFGARRGVAVGGLLAGLVLGFGGPLLAARATPAALVEASRVLRGPDGRRDPARRLVAVRSDETTTASVVDAPPGDRMLYTDEFAAAATGASYGYMRMLGHLPVLAATEPENALVIAFGTGTTTGALATHPDVARIEVVETSRAVLALADRFETVNGRVLAVDEQGRRVDDRIRVRVEDGRHALLLHAPDLDIITLEPLMPYTPAALPFYTREFYELARSRLRDGGVCCQWVPVHAMPVDLYASLLRTFFETFPDGSLWFFEQSTVLVGRVGASKPATTDVVARGREAQRAMRAAGFTTAPALAMAWVASARRVLAVLDDPSKSSEEAVRASPPGPLAARVVTDDVPFPEAYPLPRAGLVTPYLANTMLWLSGLSVPDDDPSASPELGFVAPEMLGTVRSQTRAALRARAIEAIGDTRIAQVTGRVGAAADDARAQGYANLDEALDTYKQLAAGEGLGDVGLARRRARVERRLLEVGARRRFAAWDAAIAAGDRAGIAAARDDALATARKAFELESIDLGNTGHPDACALLGEALVRAGRCAEAEEILTLARRQYPWVARIGDLLTVAAARRRGADAAAIPAGRALGGWVAHLEPCLDGDVAAVRPLLDRYRQAYFELRVDRMRQVAEQLLARVGADGVTAAGVARELAELPVPTGPVGDAERSALQRILDPGAGRLLAMMEDPFDLRWRAAIDAAARWGFERTHTTDAVLAAYVKSPDPGRRRVFLVWVAAERSRWAAERAVDLLADVDEGVRTAAWDVVRSLIPAASVASVGYDPASADGDARRAAAERARALLPPAR